METCIQCSGEYVLRKIVKIELQWFYIIAICILHEICLLIGKLAIIEAIDIKCLLGD